MKHKLILTKTDELFQDQVDRLCADGWLIVSGTIIIKQTDSGRQWFSCVMESQEPDRQPEGWGVFTKEEWELKNRPKLDKLIVDFAAASDSQFVQLQYNNHTGNWLVFHNVGDLSALANFLMTPVEGTDLTGDVPPIITDNPFIALAAAIRHVQKDGI